MRKIIRLCLLPSILLGTLAYATTIGPPDDPIDTALLSLCTNPGATTVTDPTVTVSQLDRSKFPIVEMYVDALDPEGNPLGDLTHDDFCVEQDGLPVDFQVSRVDQGDCPTSICLVIDKSGSMDSLTMVATRAAVGRFIDLMGPLDRLGIVTFSTCVETTHVFSSDTASLHAAVNNLVAGGATAAFDGFWLGVDVAAPELGSKAVIGFTDGLENRSQTCWPPPDGLFDETFADDSAVICGRANAAGVPIYSIGLGLNAGSLPLEAFSAGTGGYYRFAPTPAAIDTIYREIRARLCSRYFITFASPDTISSGDEHSVVVCVGGAICAPCDTATYVEPAPPPITLDSATVALFLECRPESTPISICADVTDAGPPLTQQVVLHYRVSGTSTFASQSMTDQGGGRWCATIPGSLIPPGTPGVDFYVVASDGETTVSEPASDPRRYPQVIAICPNDPPRIFHTPPLRLVAADVSILARIADDRRHVERATLYYRRFGEILFDSTAMANVRDSTYEGIVPASYAVPAGIDYIIRAWDDFGVRAEVGPRHLDLHADTCLAMRPGDANGDGVIDSDDAAYLTAFLCAGGPPPEPLAGGDPDGNCVVDTSDIVYLTDYLADGPSPVNCTCVEPLVGTCRLPELCGNSWTDSCITVCPGGDVRFSVYLRDQDDRPVVGSRDAWLDFDNCPSIIPCPGETEWPVVRPIAPSDTAGRLVFTVQAGGCDNWCRVTVRSSCGVIATVPYKTLDADGDLLVTPQDLAGTPACGVGTGADQLLLTNRHWTHDCTPEACALIDHELLVLPPANLQPGDTASVRLTVRNNASTACTLEEVHFFESDFGIVSVGQQFAAVAPNRVLAAGAETVLTVPYTIPAFGAGCVRAHIYTSCCESFTVAEYCAAELRLDCAPDSAVTWSLPLDTSSVYYLPQTSPIPLGFRVTLDPGEGWITSIETLTVTVSIDTVTSLGERLSVALLFFTDDSYSHLIADRLYTLGYQLLRGDVNGDCEVTAADVIYLVNFVFKAGPEPRPIRAVADVDCQEGITAADVIYLVNYAFKAGPTPPDCP